MTEVELRAELAKHSVRLVEKSQSWLLRSIGWFLCVTGINKRFMDDYFTTIGRTIYYPKVFSPDTDLYRYRSTFEHELVHVAQFERFWHLYSLTYVLLPIPFGLAWFRWRWEREAYQVNRRNGRTVDECVEALWQYGWPWPKSWMRKWFELHQPE